LDGASSSGKTALAEQLQRLSGTEVLFRLSVDDFLHCFPASFLQRACTSPGMELLHATLAKFHQTVVFAAGLHDAVVVDHVLQFPRWREDILALVDRDSLLYVQVFCPLPILETREKARGDRNVGLARCQFESVYSFEGYDIRIDTSTVSAQEGAEEVLRHFV
jgi:chloramphenicol 3-O phosphotransferase